MARSFQRRCAFFPGAGFRTVPAADRRSSRLAATGVAGARKSARATSRVARLFRRLLGAGRRHGRARVRRAVDETLRRREGRSDGGRVSRRSWSWRFMRTLQTACREVGLLLGDQMIYAAFEFRRQDDILLL